MWLAGLQPADLIIPVSQVPSKETMSINGGGLKVTRAAMPAVHLPAEVASIVPAFHRRLGQASRSAACTIRQLGHPHISEEVPRNAPSAGARQMARLLSLGCFFA